MSIEALDADRTLVDEARKGRYAAFEQLVSRHERGIYTLALRILRHREDAQDAVQETFISALEHLADFRGESTFKSWLSRIGTNEALQLLRKRKRLPAALIDAESQDEASATAPLPDMIARWRDDPERLVGDPHTRQVLARALESLDDKYRVVFVLRDVEGLSTAETAAALSIGESNVKVRLLRARLMLRERLTREFGDERTRVARGHAHE